MKEIMVCDFCGYEMEELNECECCGRTYCEDCGSDCLCDECGEKEGNLMRCDYCGYESESLDICNHCGRIYCDECGTQGNFCNECAKIKELVKKHKNRKGV